VPVALRKQIAIEKKDLFAPTKNNRSISYKTDENEIILK
jgi:hypothetical protein